ncbi:MAG: DUF4974 domain-containing protein [Chitinophagaceae bacterium]|nr:MAG: DUF4974 domain-containing protein [Chitinophagaceae bacterium]
MPVTSDSRLEYLLKRYVDGICTQEEKEELLSIIQHAQQDEQLKGLMDQVWSRLSSAYRLNEEQSTRILSAIFNPFMAEETIRSGKKSIYFMRWSAVAAVLAVLILAGGIMWFKNDIRVKKIPGVLTQTQHDIAPGGNKAVLTLANGKKIILDSLENGALPTKYANNITKVNNGLLVFNRQSSIANPASAGNRPSEYNTLSTPRGGQYRVILPDGSKVWLNAASSLTFPTAFTGKSREVKVTGEAYFEITPDKDMPFKVDVNQVEVKVLGTHFDVMAYSDEPAIKTTLLEGAVEVSKGNEEVVLKPGQQASFSAGSDKINVNVAEVEEVMAWKDGLFFFHNTNIQSVLHEIARWYNVKVVYKGETNAYLNGMISRNTELSQVLHMLEVTSNVHLKIDGRNVIVSQADK